MRRNAESLLVLVGETSPRPWSAPLPVADVIRAALSEVEDYRRVVLRRVDEGWVAGAVVAEVAHMLAELVENGLSFSSPDLEVEIYGRKTGNRYLLAVVDYGIGMPREELEKAKARLRDEENFLVAPTRFLGHYVVGRLAAQLKVQVELGESPVTGITARMLLPAELVSDRPDTNADTGSGKRGRGRSTTSTGPQQVIRSGPSTGPQQVIPATVEPSPPAAPARTTVSTSASTQRIPPVSKPPAPTPAPPQPQPVVAAYHPPAPAHRWPTEQELANQAEGPARTVSVATLANTAPYNPARANVGQNNGSAAKSALPGSPSEERTRNGLVKRQPRHRGASVSRPPASPMPSRHSSDSPAARDRSPSEVSSMLSAFRSGHQRGELTVNGRSPISDEPTQSPVVREEEPGDH
jgi:anti-sigma regulatory factor (Ser/Thr protein kinase)